MIRRLRFKFVAICMALVTVVLAGVFFSVYATAARNMEGLSRQVLRQVLQEDGGQFGGTPFRPDASISIGGERVLLPYFTVNIWGDTVYVTGGTYSDLENTEALRSILTECLSQGAQEGTVSSYRLRYLRQDNGLYQKIAFVDMSMEQKIRRKMIRK